MIGTLYRTVVKPVVRTVTPLWVWKRYGDALWLWKVAFPTDLAAARVIGWPAVVALRMADPRFTRRGRDRRLRLPSFPHPIHYRPGSSDPLVIRQVFDSQEYGCVAREPDIKYILDCGANIGLTTLYLLHHYPHARAVVVEPDSDNMRVCRRNLAPFADRVTFVESGVWSAAVPLVVEREMYGDGLDWAIQVRPTREGEDPDVNALTVSDLLTVGQFPRVDILKMDIEAAEAAVFSGPTDWLDHTRTLVIELHGPECERVVGAAVAGRLIPAGMFKELTVFRRFGSTTSVSLGGTMSFPVVSVLMPVYNAERYLAEAVESILGQTFAEFEFLIVDDGSTDASLAILRKYAARDSRIVLASRPNTGIAVALNELLGQARGEFVARMDADDVSLPDRFERQLAFLRANPEVLAVGGALTVIDENGSEKTTMQLPEQDSEIQALALSGATPLCHPTVIMRREALIAVGGYRKELVPAEDLDLWLRLGERGRLANLAQIVLRYREHGGSISSQNSQLQVDRLRQAADEATDRRGLPRRSLDLQPYRPTQDRRSRHRFALRNGWWGFLRGDRIAAIRFGVKAIAYLPWSSDGWRLLACALIKPIRRPPK